MTGSSAFIRQMSSTDGKSNIDKTQRPSLRRYSSADDHTPLEPLPDLGVIKEKLTNTIDQSANDIDSGTEDNETVENQLANSPTNAGNVEDDQQIEFRACDDEGYAESRVPTPTNEGIYSLEKIQHDLELASQIAHELKKSFCPDTKVVFHAEFARLIGLLVALAYPGLSYIFCALEELPLGSYDSIGFFYIVPLNAKAQFQCTGCKRLWTSMRARCAFHITEPRPVGFIVLQIFGQECKVCGAEAEALWYPEEVCRVMAELTQDLFGRFFPNLLPTIQSSLNAEPTTMAARSGRSIHYNPKQRKGKMSAPHDSARCSACKNGLCFPQQFI